MDWYLYVTQFLSTNMRSYSCQVIAVNFRRGIFPQWYEAQRKMPTLIITLHLVTRPISEIFTPAPANSSKEKEQVRQVP